jgi:hypothetical protein
VAAGGQLAKTKLLVALNHNTCNFIATDFFSTTLGIQSYFAILRYPELSVNCFATADLPIGKFA